MDDVSGKWNLRSLRLNQLLGAILHSGTIGCGHWCSHCPAVGVVRELHHKVRKGRMETHTSTSHRPEYMYSSYGLQCLCRVVFRYLVLITLFYCVSVSRSHTLRMAQQYYEYVNYKEDHVQEQKKLPKGACHRYVIIFQSVFFIIFHVCCHWSNHLSVSE